MAEEALGRESDGVDSEVLAAARSVVGDVADRSWAVADVCTLPSEQRPLRVAEFAALFRDAVRAADRVSPTRLRLDIDATAEVRARDLAARETHCCSFFTFEFIMAGKRLVHMNIDVPPARTEVLDALAALATTGRLA